MTYTPEAKIAINRHGTIQCLGCLYSFSAQSPQIDGTTFYHPNSETRWVKHSSSTTIGPFFDACINAGKSSSLQDAVRQNTIDPRTGQQQGGDYA